MAVQTPTHSVLEIPMRLSSEFKRPCRVSVFAALLLLALSPVGCTDDSGGPTPPDEGVEPTTYGAMITPRVSYEADWTLSGAYQSLTGDGYEVAHASIRWSEIVPTLDREYRDWESLGRHVRNARQNDIGLSLVFELIHGGEVDLPQWIEFQGWTWDLDDDPTFFFTLTRFLRELQLNALGTIDYLWIGEGLDRYVERYPDQEEFLLPFFVELADSLEVIFPDTRLGIMVSPALTAQNGRTEYLRSFRDLLGGVALSVFPEELVGSLPAPAAAVEAIEDAIDPWADGPVAVVETGYSSAVSSGSSYEIQSAFVSRLADWLRRRPETLELFCWAPIHDARFDLAETLATLRYPHDQEDRDRFARILESCSMRRLDGSRKPARETYIEERP
jgi:hypothetical protein